MKSYDLWRFVAPLTEGQRQALAVFSALIGAAQRTIILTLTKGPKTMKEVILETGQSRSSVLRILRLLQRKQLVVADGKLKSKRRRYRLIRVAFGQAADCLLALANARLDAQDIGIKGKHDGKAIERLAVRIAGGGRKKAKTKGACDAAHCEV